MFKTRKLIKNDNGFSLVELMVTVFLTVIAVIAIYRGYTAFSQATDAQQQVIEMQQNLRIGMTRMIVDIRRAGMNEEGDDIAGFIAAGATSVEFSMDIGSANGPVVFATDGEDNDGDGVTDDPADSDAATAALKDEEAALEAEEESRVGDGDVDDDGERIKYSLVASTLDPTTNDLQREVWDNATAAYIAQTLITNVEALNFVYWREAIPEIPPAAAVPSARFVPVTASDLEEIDRVEITLVVRATNEDYRITNGETYRNLVPGVPGDIYTVSSPDNFRRRAFSMSVQIRNNI